MSDSGTYSPSALNEPASYTVSTADLTVQPRVYLNNMASGDELKISVSTDTGKTNQEETIVFDDLAAGDRSVEFPWYGLDDGNTFTLTLEQTAGTVKDFDYELNYRPAP